MNCQNSRLRWLTIAFLVPLASLVSSLSCGGANPRRPTAPASGGGSSLVVPGGRLPLCELQRPAMARTVQLLIDDSGSMAGFRGELAGVANWLDLTLTKVLAGGSDIKNSVQTCLFGGSAGVHSCAPGRFNTQRFAGRGETALLQAVAAAHNDRDITIILTDGVAASGAGQMQACSSGVVDPICVARELGRFTEPPPGRANVSGMGIWLVPVRLNFKGVLFTEQRADLNSLDLRAAESRATSQLKSVVKLSGPNLDREGRLELQYEGQRYAMILVLSRSVDVGRTFVHAMYGTPAVSGSGLNPEMPWELFPGMVPLPGDAIANPAKVSRRQSSGNFAILPGPREPLKISCEKEVTGDIVFPKRTPVAGTCIEALSFPTLELGPAEVLQNQGTASSNVFSVDASAAVRVKCGDLKTCAEGVSQISIPTFFSKERTVGALSTDPQLKGALDLLNAESLVADPHRIHSLRVLVNTFYKSINVGSRVGTWRDVNVCR
jgi:hypothetical protein